MTGSKYALLRPKFSLLRHESINRRSKGKLENLLISMGGTDIFNSTLDVVRSLHRCNKRLNLNITIVMGSNAPWLESVIKSAERLPYRCEVLVGINNMAEVMSKSDFAIGAAGSTSWERCCMGLPAAQVVLAENQRKIAYELEKIGAAVTINRERLSDDIGFSIENFATNPTLLIRASEASASVTDGLGVQRVVQQILKG